MVLPVLHVVHNFTHAIHSYNVRDILDYLWLNNASCGSIFTSMV